MRTCLYVALLALSVAALATPVAAAGSFSVSVVGGDGALVSSGEPGTLDVTVERWDDESRSHERVQTLSREVEPGEYLLRFDRVEEEGHYRATFELGGERVTRSFRYKVRELPKIADAAYSADGGGGSLFLSPQKATFVDVRMALTRGGRVVDSRTVEDRVLSSPLNLERGWTHVLSAGERYGSAAVVDSRDTTRLMLDSFVATRDASVEVASSGEDGASVRVTGESGVPLDATLRATLERDGETVESFDRDPDRLLDGETRTLDLFWSDVLDPGDYLLRVRVASDGKVLDTASSSIAAEQDAEITDVFGDASGATVTVEGDSEIALDAEVRILLEREGETVREERVDSPVVLTGNEETVEVAWGAEPEPGDYVVRGELIADGETFDRGGNVFTVEEPVPTRTGTPTETPGPGAVVPVALAAAAYLIGRP